ncbi:MAG: ImmA/IrrE family metallo-endopeptidase [Clostridiales bacterium]|nr:ImmA/IrrE family metallo-endopeptidase [Clostridiales bacterium]
MNTEGLSRSEQLSRVGSRLVKRCGTRDPFEIAEQIGVNVMFCENFGTLKGMYRVIKRNRFIFLNQDLDENTLRIVCAHELGHDQLHRQMAKNQPIQEFVLYSMKSVPEYEANIVASEILIDSNEVLDYIFDYGYTAEQIARAMSIDINLVALKISHLVTLGYPLRTLEHRSDFLK